MHALAPTIACASMCCRHVALASSKCSPLAGSHACPARARCVRTRPPHELPKPIGFSRAEIAEIRPSNLSDCYTKAGIAGPVASAQAANGQACQPENKLLNNRDFNLSLMHAIHLEYPTTADNRPRYGPQRRVPAISGLIEAARPRIAETLARIVELADGFAAIANHSHPRNPLAPALCNDYLPGLDSLAYWALIGLNRPRQIVEVGSGNSTKFARHAITHFKIGTRLTSIDPYPRAEIDQLCDGVIRQPLESTDLRVFDELEAGDLVFIDNSHRSFMNSDVTVAFLELIPRLRPGVWIHVHDICWPDDYPIQWAERYYNEQYLLGCMMAYGFRGLQLELPLWFASHDAQLRTIPGAFWQRDPRYSEVQQHGMGFWMSRTEVAD
jgi:Methyltransferase domain